MAGEINNGNLERGHIIIDFKNINIETLIDIVNRIDVERLSAALSILRGKQDNKANSNLINADDTDKKLKLEMDSNPVTENESETEQYEPIEGTEDSNISNENLENVSKETISDNKPSQSAGDNEINDAKANIEYNTQKRNFEQITPVNNLEEYKSVGENLQTNTSKQNVSSKATTGGGANANNDLKPDEEYNAQKSNFEQITPVSNSEQYKWTGENLQTNTPKQNIPQTTITGKGSNGVREYNTNNNSNSNKDFNTQKNNIGQISPASNSNQNKVTGENLQANTPKQNTPQNQVGRSSDTRRDHTAYKDESSNKGVSPNNKSISSNKSSGGPQNDFKYAADKDKTAITSNPSNNQSTKSTQGTQKNGNPVNQIIQALNSVQGKNSKSKSGSGNINIQENPPTRAAASRPVVGTSVNTVNKRLEILNAIKPMLDYERYQILDNIIKIYSIGKLL